MGVRSAPITRRGEIVGPDVGDYVCHAHKYRGYGYREEARTDPGPELRRVQGVKYSDLRLLSFPLEIGKKWSFSSVSTYPSGTFNDYACSAVVVSYEKVRVPAGEFDAFKLEAKCNFRAVGEMAGDPGESTWKYSYAPAARIIVDYQYTNSRMGTTSIRRLSEFQLQP